MPTRRPFNQDMITELIEENVALRVLLSCATGEWLTTEDDEEKQDALVIPSDQIESMEGR